MDESGELGGLETMETLTELGDELTLGDIDGEWWVGGSAGARGEEGVTAARAGARAPPARSSGSRGKNPHARSPRLSPAFPGAAELNPGRAARLRKVVGSALGSRVSLSGARVVKQGARSRGRRGGRAGATRGERAAAASLARLPPLSRAYTRLPKSRSPVAPVTPLPAAGAALGFPGLDPHSPRPQLWSSGVDPRPGAGETLGSE